MNQISIKRQKHGSVELVDIDIRIDTIRSNTDSTNYYGSNGGIRNGISTRTDEAYKKQR